MMANISEIILIFLLTVLVSMASYTAQQEPKYLTVLSNATLFSVLEKYDYIIVGGGTAGCPLAATLSHNFTVLLLERGGPEHTVPSIREEEGFMTNLVNADEDSSPAQGFTSEDGVVSARGRVLGGSSSINAGFYSRAGVDYVREAGWKESLVNESYRWVERRVVSQPLVKQWQGAFRDGLIEAGIRPYNGFSLDHIEGTKVGGSTFDASGRRRTSAELLEHANMDNLKIVLHATVKRILFREPKIKIRGEPLSKPMAYGVEFLDKNGVIHRAILSDGGGDVILSSGALGSPQLLLLSGIGPREHLASLGIPIVHNLPGVGQGMADNPRNGITVLSPLPLEYSLIKVVGITPSTFIEASSTPIPIPFHIARRAVDLTQLQSQNASSFYPRTATDRYPNNALSYSREVYMGSIIEKIPGPFSKGELRLRSVDVKDTPSVTFNYFSHPQDLQNCVDGLKIIDRVLKTGPLRTHTHFFIGPQLPTDTSNDTAMRAFCRETVATIWHYHGGCQVGSVVNERYQVQGIDSLRVIDGSTFCKSPGTNPQATVMMLGRYMGSQILRERLSNAS